MEAFASYAESADCVSPKRSREIARLLQKTRLFAKYQRSFEAASGLPLSIRPLESFQMPACGSPRENPFCALLARSRKGCVACLQTQSELEAKAKRRAVSLRCQAGLHDSVAPIVIGEKRVAYLQTGQVRIVSADADVSQIGDFVNKLGDIDTSKARWAYLQSRQLTSEAYEGFLSMLEVFAETLGAAANTLLLEQDRPRESALVSRTVEHVERHYQRRIPLGEVSKVAGASERHFCKVFKKETGLSFVAYLTRFRVQRAQKELRETARQISEIAFDSGFESIAQFNRAFKSVSGESPSAYRKRATS
ncbi:helix-turn-helix domain-containing protein [Pelagicoccus sp. SDUM812003]|uniref:helix-turn-helix domain-containing protein n=1 Tax=Pelagicoccus sp. SDUM812003 TaxID=3041267 RepID=UPI00280F76E0|nr:helix-turn-helix domain-containing protein [Pelagicoccus sp. SDUM812003]MDQ8203635.1 helix-turn-helix domain-containing protein [Pelagicoccus sp. SDUM812003]